MQTSLANQKIFNALLLADTPFIDLRAPVEFEQGAFPSSINLPLMTNEERHLVGICYKKKGQEAAISLGYKLVENEIAGRINAWSKFKESHPNAWLYCFRGGMRSKLSAQFLKDQGVDIKIIPGGFKALRRYLIDVIDNASSQNITIVGGNTGCGKTKLIQELKNGLDIEGRANHRGSSFGKMVTPQPKQISYENQLAIDILKIAEYSSSLVIEDESKGIGVLHVPLNLFEKMNISKVVVINDPLDIRLERLRYEYTDLMTMQFKKALGQDAGWQAYDEYLHRGLYGIRKRLGSMRHLAMSKILENALAHQKLTGDTEAHLNWIEPLLKNYYDPMYQYQLDKKADRISFSGNYDEVKAWLKTNTK